MKLNNRGVSILELIISLSLIAVVMLFMYNLLSNVTFEKDNDYIATMNANNRTDIISTLEDKLMCLSITNYNTSDNNIVFSDSIFGDYILDIDNEQNSISFDTRKWHIKAGTIGKISCQDSSFNEELGIKFVECTIPIYTNNSNNMENNNNTLDDITFSFILQQ